MQTDNNELSLAAARSLYDSVLARVSSLEQTAEESERKLLLEQIDAILGTVTAATVQPAAPSLVAKARSLQGMARLSLAFGLDDQERRTALIRSGASLVSRSGADLAASLPATAVSIIPDQLEALAAAMGEASPEDKQHLTEVYEESFRIYVASLQQLVMLRDEGAAKVLQANLLAIAAEQMEPGRDRTVLLWEAAGLSGRAGRLFAVLHDGEALEKAVEVHGWIREQLGVMDAGSRPEEPLLHPIGGVQREEPVSRGQSETPPATLAPPGRIFCTNCGSPMDVGDAFCGQCGQKV